MNAYAHHPGQGQCPDCGQWLKIVGFGAVASHDGRRLGLSGQCLGSDSQPVKPVPCITCHRTGLALQSTGECTSCARHRRDAEDAARRAETEARQAARGLPGRPHRYPWA